MEKEISNWQTIYSYTDTAGRTFVVEALVEGGAGDIRTIEVTNQTKNS